MKHEPTDYVYQHRLSDSSETSSDSSSLPLSSTDEIFENILHSLRESPVSDRVSSDYQNAKDFQLQSDDSQLYNNCVIPSQPNICFSPYQRPLLYVDPWEILRCHYLQLKEQYDKYIYASERSWFHRRPKQLPAVEYQDQLLQKINMAISDFGDETLSPRLVDRGSWTNVHFSELNGLYLRHHIKKFVVPEIKRRERILMFLTHLHDRISNGRICTRRDYYYHEVPTYGRQETVDNAVDDVIVLLRVPKLHLGIITSGKGLCSGQLKVHLACGSTIDFSHSAAGHSIPPEMTEIMNMTSSARYVLIVEKDATFQSLTRQTSRDTDDCIIVTAKGYPDANTRHFVRLLYEFLHLPIFAIVDCDPHGIEIMCMYRYGALAKAYDHLNLVTPQVRWIGIFPSEFEHIGVKQHSLLDMTKIDMKKCHDLLNRPYVKQNGALMEEIHILTERRKKIEIQALNDIHADYLLSGYVARKVREGHFI
ncbi:Meiotic recombination protein SPO11 [Halotydeus destructor]|nr:Meiotic recombination protein SPO11 [Halotydeus destructor]